VRGLTAFNASSILPESASVVIVNLSITIWQDELAPGGIATPDLRVVLSPGDTLACSSGADIDLTVSGFALTLP
jgi:hypothetical protein